MEKMRGRERCLQYLYACKPSLCMQAFGRRRKTKERGEKSLKQPSLVVGEEEE